MSPTIHGQKETIHSLLKLSLGEIWTGLRITWPSHQALFTIAAILVPILQPKLAMWSSREQTMQIIGKSAYPHTPVFFSKSHRSVR